MTFPVGGIYSEQVVRAGLPTFPHAQYVLHYANTNLSAGALDITLDTVPTDYVYILTHAGFYYVGTSPTEMQLILGQGADAFLIQGKKSPVTQEFYPISCWVMAVAGDTIRLLITAATAGNDAHAWVMGYKIYLPT